MKTVFSQCQVSFGLHKVGWYCAALGLLWPFYPTLVLGSSFIAGIGLRAADRVLCFFLPSFASLGRLLLFLLFAEALEHSFHSQDVDGSAQVVAQCTEVDLSTDFLHPFEQ